MDHPGFSDADMKRMLTAGKNPPPATVHMGFELIDLSGEDGWVEASFMPRPEFANPTGAVQGGFVAAMLDEVMAIAACAKARFTIVVPTLQLTITYLAPAPIEKLYARGEVVRLGRSAAQMRGSLRDGTGKLLAEAIASAVPRPFPGREQKTG